MTRGNKRRKSKSILSGVKFNFFQKHGGSAAAVWGARKRSAVQHDAPRQASAAYLVLFVLLAFSVTVGLIYHLHLRFEGVWLGYETSRARAERAQLTAEQRELRLELSSLKSPERVEAEAREKLGMEMPELDQIVPMEKRATPVLASGRAR